MRFSFLFLLALSVFATPQSPITLRCEYLTDPVGIDVAKPRFYWVLRDADRAVVQSAYQILVSSDPGAAQGDQWDSGKIASPESIQVEYVGKPLESSRIYYWKVRYWDQSGQPSPYSAPAKFETGILDSSLWKARWLRGGNVMRKEFDLGAAPVRARAYVTGIGYYELRINGGKIGNRVLDPGYTRFDRRILYTTYDVTSQLKAGRNAVGMMLGEGWYHDRAGFLQLEIELPGGRHQTVSTDATWKTSQGAILSDSLYNGETYDARREQAGWDRPNFDDSSWKPVTLENPPAGILSAEMMPPIRVTATLVPKKMSSPRAGAYIFDMGQNFSGWTRIHVKGPAGTRVVLRHAEVLYEDGTINVENLRTARATDTYILRGDPDGETYEPRFTYHGFRYVEVTGWPGVPSVNDVNGREVHTDVQTAGGFASSNAMLNQLQQNILWGVKSNLHSIPTDCDQRDERMGWLADAHLAAETAMLNFDMAAFYTNFLRGIRDDQEDDGSLPDTVPRGKKQPNTDPAWGAAYPLLVDYMWEQYADRRIVETHFNGIRNWAEWLHKKADADGIVSYVKFGDWVPIEHTPGDLVSTAYYYKSVDVVAKMAAVLGKTAEATQYRQLADSIAAGFRKRFYHLDTHSFANDTQTANALPLAFGMVPTADQKAVTASITDDIVYYKNTHLTTGILGTSVLLPVLSAHNRSDLAYELATQTTYPSWGYMIEHGATTIWELWQEVTGPSMNSHNHPMFGSIGAWFYTSLAGIHTDPAHPGYERIRIAPEMTRDLHYASGSLETIRGRVASEWRREPGKTQLAVTIPTGSAAEVELPVLLLNQVEVQEGGHTVWKGGAFVPGAPGITAARLAGGTLVFEVGSGNYAFEAHDGDLQ